ncbi:hypothetical protein L596_021781 [Steinernema carpocapsae]|uniref:Uncharacterized protein n=1 Tax=Steinernema carpocapsae TaxID=34508 RepID=A0A4U5MJT7_STECR|nr:hypothetical protein L596_021781 [Steinernema carpocapsae]
MELVVPLFHESAISAVIFTLASFVFVPILMSACSKKPKANAAVCKNSPDASASKPTSGAKSDPKSLVATKNAKSEVPPSSDGTELMPRSLVPTNKDEKEAYDKIVRGTTRSAKDNETLEGFDSDWGSVKVVEEVTKDGAKTMDSKDPKNVKSEKSCKTGEDSSEASKTF